MKLELFYPEVVRGGQVAYHAPLSLQELTSNPEKYYTVELCMYQKETGVTTGLGSHEKKLSMGEVGSFDDE
jgi:hypothetical protein